MVKTQNVYELLRGKKVLVMTNFQVEVELTIGKAEDSVLGEVCLIFTNGTYQNYKKFTDIKFVES